MEVLTASEMRDKLKVSRETFRKTWRRYPRIPAGTGENLRSARFLWDEGAILEKAYGCVEVQDEKRNTLSSAVLSRRRNGSGKSGIQKQAGCSSMGRRAAQCDEIDINAKRLGLI